MKPLSTIALGLLLAALLGAGANRLLVAVPAPVENKPLAEAPWMLSAVPHWDGGAVDAAWAEAAPWGAAPKPAAEAAAAVAAPPQPELVGVIKHGAAYRAVFSIAGAGQLALAPGTTLPGGGRVLSVQGLRVVWVDADGIRHQREIFNTYQEESAPR